MSKKAKRSEAVQIESAGIVYNGSRVIEGTLKLSQTIYYQGKSRFDPKMYRPGQENSMRAIAQLILGELVRGQ